MGHPPTRILLVLALLGASGCSLMFVKKAPAQAWRVPTGCTETRVFPVVDVGMAGLGGVIGVAGLGSRNLSGGDKALTALIFLVPAAIHAYSAYVGFEETSRCGLALARYDDNAPRRAPPPRFAEKDPNRRPAPGRALAGDRAPPMRGYRVRVGDDTFEARDADELRGWVIEGRVLPDDYVYVPGTGGWTRARDLPVLEPVWSGHLPPSPLAEWAPPLAIRP